MAGAGTDGPHPAETLGALASVLSIWVVTGALVYLAAARIISNDYEIEARAMLATSASAVGVNLVYVPRSLIPASSVPTQPWPEPCPMRAPGVPNPQPQPPLRSLGPSPQCCLLLLPDPAPHPTYIPCPPPQQHFPSALPSCPSPKSPKSPSCPEPLYSGCAVPAEPWLCSLPHPGRVSGASRSLPSPEPALLPAAWHTSCTRPPPSTATVWGAMSSWRARGAACPAMPPCLAAPASVQPSSTWWATCCRALVSWWPPPSSTSRCVVPAWAGLLSSTGHWGALGGTGGHWVPTCWCFLPAASCSPCSLQPQCKIADPISTLFFSVFVLGSTLTILRDVFRVLMEGEGRTGKGVQGLLREHRAAHPTATSAPYPAHPQHFWPL